MPVGYKYSHGTFYGVPLTLTQRGFRFTKRASAYNKFMGQCLKDKSIGSAIRGKKKAEAKGVLRNLMKSCASQYHG